jgi:hypothetical protein
MLGSKAAKSGKQGVAATWWMVIFQGGLAVWSKKSFIFAGKSHFGVAATLFKLGSCERMRV